MITHDYDRLCDDPCKHMSMAICSSTSLSLHLSCALECLCGLRGRAYFIWSMRVYIYVQTEFIRRVNFMVVVMTKTTTKLSAFQAMHAADILHGMASSKEASPSANSAGSRISPACKREPRTVTDESVRRFKCLGFETSLFRFPWRSRWRSAVRAFCLSALHKAKHYCDITVAVKNENSTTNRSHDIAITKSVSPDCLDVSTKMLTREPWTSQTVCP